MSATIRAVWAAMAVNMNLYSRGFESCKVGLGRQAGSIEFFERFRDAFCLRTRKAALLQFFDHAVGIYHQALHRLSVYHASVRSQGNGRRQQAV